MTDTRDPKSRSALAEAAAETRQEMREIYGVKYRPPTPADLADLKAKAKAATPGPWCVIDEMLMQDYGENDLVADGRYWHFERNKVDLAYVAAANPETILRLIAMIERLQSADMKRGIENAAYERAARAVTGRGFYLSNGKSADEIICALITPAKTADTEE